MIETYFEIRVIESIAAIALMIIFGIVELILYLKDKFEK